PGGFAGAETCTSSCQAGSSGDNSGEFSVPVEVAIDSAGNVFVGDKNNDRIDVVKADGSFERAFGADVGGTGMDVCTTSCGAGTSGGGAAELEHPSGVALDGLGNVYAGEESGNRVSVFTSAGTFVRAFGADVGGTGVNVCTTASGCSQA